MPISIQVLTTEGTVCQALCSQNIKHGEIGQKEALNKPPPSIEGQLGPWLCRLLTATHLIWGFAYLSPARQANMPELPRTPKSARKGGRPQKYHTPEERKRGINAVRRERRCQARNRQQNDDNALDITFERCSVIRKVGPRGTTAPPRSTTLPLEKRPVYDNDGEAEECNMVSSAHPRAYSFHYGYL
jgi:hypothetical protein